MDKIETGEANMDAKMLDGREVVAELVREARADAAEDRFLTNRANMDMADRVISIVALVFGAVCVCALLAHVLFVYRPSVAKAIHLEPPQGKPPQRCLSPLWWFLFLREGRDADGRPYGRRYCR